MRHATFKWGLVLACGLASGLAPLPVWAGKALKWEQVPEAVRKTILTNGGVEGNDVDLENEVKDGKKVYEAPVKDKEGKVHDLVITEDGKLVETKHDDEKDAADERTQRAKALLADVKFSHPTQINNPWLPLGTLKQDILEGTEDGKKVHIERTVRPDLHKTFTIGGQTIEALVVEDRETVDGEIEEVAIDYFAQDDKGTVYYLGEDVDEYKGGRVVSHEGSWLFGKDTPVPGVIFPAAPKVGLIFRSEDVSNQIHEKDEVVAVGETVKTPAGEFKDCIKVKEKLADGKIEFKYYAKGVGVVRETPSNGDVLLKSHATK